MSSAGTGSVTALNAITWKAATGLIKTRRGLFINNEDFHPHISLNPMGVTTEPADSDLVEGEIYYSAPQHALMFRDDTANQKLVSMKTDYMTVDSTQLSGATAIAGLKLQAINLGAGSVWLIEWDLYLTYTVTTATLTLAISSPASSTGQWNVMSSNGTAGTTATAKNISINLLSNTVIAAAAIGNPGSTTDLVSTKVRAVVSPGAVGNVALLFGASSGFIVVKKFSSMKAQRLA